MITTLIADDENHALIRLRDLLSQYDQFEIVAEAKDGTGALEKIVTLKPQLVFLDIHMPGVNVFKTISALQHPPLVVFQTAYANYASDAFDINAVDYLMKPISKERFKLAVSKILEKLTLTQQRVSEKKSQDVEKKRKISIKAGEAIKIFNAKEIQKICFEDGLSFVYTRKGRFLADKSLNHYEEKLGRDGFFRTNRASLVNLNHIVGLHKTFKGGFYVELADGSTVQLSRRKATALKKIIDF